jgi:hypothetical protein
MKERFLKCLTEETALELCGHLLKAHYMDYSPSAHSLVCLVKFLLGDPQPKDFIDRCERRARELMTALGVVFVRDYNPNEDPDGDGSISDSDDSDPNLISKP